MISRRTFLATTFGALVAESLMRPAILLGSDDPGVSIAGEEGLIVRSARFLDLETPPEFLNTWITPVPHFFVRNHMHEPMSVDSAEWKLTIGGEVEKPFSLTLPELKKMKSHSVTNTLECAGNGRAFHNPHVPGIQWQKGAVGNASFAGPRLSDLLQRAGLKSSGKRVMFRGLDEVPGKVPQFIRSIPIEKALDEDTVVATEMNGAPLSRHHGFPARALVPGWIGAASCKWLTEIKILDKEFDGNFMKPGYRYPNHPLKPGDALNVEDSHVLSALNVKSIFSTPSDGATYRSHSVHLQGMAWAGESEVAKVEISADAGSTWQLASLGRERAKYAWRLWSFSWKAPKPGEYTFLCRATDRSGRTQPASADWNPSGYLYNAIDQVRIHVEG